MKAWSITSRFSSGVKNIKYTMPTPRTVKRLRVPSRSYSTAPKTPNPIPSTYIRGGTSKGVFINRKYLPDNQEEWATIFQGILGSPDPIYKRQLNGMGGGISSLSKIVVVGPPKSATDPSKVDCEYTFVQVGVEDGAIDMAGNCGNLSSMVGCFAIEEGICSARVENGRGRVRSWNINTKKQIDTVFPVSIGTQGGSVRPVLDREEISMAGVPGKASRIDLEFMDPAGARTGRLLPTGRPVDVLNLPGNSLTEVSLVDATNPTVILPYHELRILLDLAPSAEVDYESAATLTVLETIRVEGAKAMTLPGAPSQPKIVVIRPPNTGLAPHEDLVVQALSMGAPHKAVPMTVGLCLGVAADIKGTTAQRMVAQTRQKAKREDKLGIPVVLRHPSGTVEVSTRFDLTHQPFSVSVTRTGRWLMKGAVCW